MAGFALANNQPKTKRLLIINYTNINYLGQAGYISTNRSKLNFTLCSKILYPACINLGFNLIQSLFCEFDVA